MYAIVHTSKVLNFDAGKIHLTTEVIPMLRNIPGFVSGTWVTDPKTESGTAVVVFESKAVAESVAARISGQADHVHVDEHIETTGVFLCEVVAQA